MTNEEINIAIHEIRGFKQVEPQTFRGKAWTDIAFEKDGHYYGGPPPRYTEDLNLMREVFLQESELYPNFVIEYERALYSVLKSNPEQPKHPFYWLSSAKEQAQAFLLYWNLLYWKNLMG